MINFSFKILLKKSDQRITLDVFINQGFITNIGQKSEFDGLLVKV